MLTLNDLNHAEKFVKQQNKAGNNVRWDNYDIVFFKENPRAMFSRNGAFRDGKWGYQSVSKVTEAGTWEVDFRNVRRIKHSRNRPR